MVLKLLHIDDPTLPLTDCAYTQIVKGNKAIKVKKQYRLIYNRFIIKFIKIIYIN